MNIEFETRCKVCNQKMEYLNHEQTVIPVHNEGDLIGVNKKMKVCNVRFYCGHCRVNQSRPFPYNDKNVVPPFIADIKKHSANFEKQEYITL